MNQLKLALRYIKYYIKAKTKYQIHSPFVFEFIQLLDDDRMYYIFEDIEYQRKKLLKESVFIDVNDLGAGSIKKSGQKRRVKDIARSALTPAYYTQLLFKIINHYKPKTILELGTSLGISTIYQASPKQDAQVYTIEGCPNIAQIAQKNFDKFKLNNVHSTIGDFEEELPKTLKKIKVLDYAFFDGNHQKRATISYFEKCLKYAHPNSIFIFDDIHWSEEMEAAWSHIQNHPKVSLTIDLFFFGLVFFRTEIKHKEHYIAINAQYKPWAKGFFAS